MYLVIGGSEETTKQSFKVVKSILHTLEKCKSIVATSKNDEKVFCVRSPKESGINHSCMAQPDNKFADKLISLHLIENK